jgi:hypothetical protein
VLRPRQEAGYNAADEDPAAGYEEGSQEENREAEDFGG